MPPRNNNPWYFAWEQEDIRPRGTTIRHSIPEEYTQYLSFDADTTLSANWGEPYVIKYRSPEYKPLGSIPTERVYVLHREDLKRMCADTKFATNRMRRDPTYYHVTKVIILWYPKEKLHLAEVWTRSYLGDELCEHLKMDYPHLREFICLLEEYNLNHNAVTMGVPKMY